jgi:hypothetical protein
MEESGELFNVTAESKYRKFPVNFDPEEFKIIQRIAEVEYSGCKAQYLRRTIQKDLRARGLLGPNTQIELFREYEPIVVEKHKIGVKWQNRPASEYVDPTRKFMGFRAGLNRSINVGIWFKKKNEQHRNSLFSKSS